MLSRWERVVYTSRSRLTPMPPSPSPGGRGVPRFEDLYPRITTGHLDTRLTRLMPMPCLPPRSRSLYKRDCERAVCIEIGNGGEGRAKLYREDSAHVLRKLGQRQRGKSWPGQEQRLLLRSPVGARACGNGGGWCMASGARLLLSRPSKNRRSRWRKSG
jgi:hypothetical protein